MYCCEQVNRNKKPSLPLFIIITAGRQMTTTTTFCQQQKQPHTMLLMSVINLTFINGSRAGTNTFRYIPQHFPIGESFATPSKCVWSLSSAVRIYRCRDIAYDAVRLRTNVASTFVLVVSKKHILFIQLAVVNLFTFRFVFPGIFMLAENNTETLAENWNV